MGGLGMWRWLVVVVCVCSVGCERSPEPAPPEAPAEKVVPVEGGDVEVPPEVVEEEPSEPAKVPRARLPRAGEVQRLELEVDALSMHPSGSRVWVAEAEGYREVVLRSPAEGQRWDRREELVGVWQEVGGVRAALARDAEGRVSRVVRAEAGTLDFEPWLELEDDAKGLAVDGSGRVVVEVGGRLELWGEAREVIAEAGVSGPVFMPSGSGVLGVAEGGVWMWREGVGERVAWEDEAVEGVREVSVSPDGRLLVLAAEGGLWVAVLGEHVRQPERLLTTAEKVTSPIWSPSGEVIVFLERGRLGWVWLR